MSKLEHTRGLAEMYQRLMPDTSKTLQEVAARVLAEIEAAEIELDTIAALTADRDRLAGELAQAIPLRQLADLMHKLEEHNARAAGCWVDLKIALTYLQLAAHPEPKP
jgi:hypothetical protein